MVQGLHRRSAGLRIAVMLLALCAIAARLIVPAGYMPSGDGQLALTLCSGTGPAVSVKLDLGKSQHEQQAPGDHQPCAFSATATPVLAGAPPLLLATAILYIVAQGPLPDTALPAAEPERLRPPLRGPPSA